MGCVSLSTCYLVQHYFLKILNLSVGNDGIYLTLDPEKIELFNGL